MNEIFDQSVKDRVFSKCEQLYCLTLNKSTFPAPNPVAFEKKDIDILHKEVYVICEKTDGERYLLVNIVLDGEKRSILVNRSNKMYSIEITFSSEVYEGTIFDGEFITNKAGESVFLVFDCITYLGVNYIQKNHHIRYNCILDCIINKYKYSTTDLFKLKTKLFFQYGPELEKTWEHIKNTTENKIDGLVFTPVHHHIKLGRDNRLFKWKCDKQHTIDLLLKYEGKKYIAYGNNCNSNYIFKIIKPSDESFKNISLFFNKQTKLPKEGYIIEFNLSNKILRPIKIRTDKSSPNNKVTIENTLKNIEENLEVQDLF